MKNMFLILWLLGITGFPVFGQVDASLDNWLQKADSLAGLRDFENALYMLGKAEEHTLNRFGETSDEYGEVCFHYGVVLHQKGNYHEAEQWLLKCRDIWERTKGRENPAYAKCLYRLGLVYYHMGNNYEKAEKCYLEARAIQEIIPGRESVEYINTILESGNLFMYTGNYTKAEKDYLEAADLYKKLTDKEDVFYGIIQRSLGFLYCKQLKFETSIPYFRSNVSIVEKEMGKKIIYRMPLVS